MRKIIAFIAFAFSALAFCAAQSLSPPIALPEAAELLPSGLAREEGKLFLAVDTGRGAAPTLAPLGFAAPGPATAGPGASPTPKTLRVELLALLPAAGSRLGAQPAPFANPTGVLSELVFILSSVHSLEGLEYWSASRGRMRTLYAEAYRIDSPPHRARLADPLGVENVSPGASKTFYAYLRDLTFGGTIFEYSIHIDRSSVWMTSENITTMSYSLLPLLAPRSMKTRILLVPCEEGVLVHFLSTADAIDIVAGRVFESAGNKSLAVLGWFAKKTAAAGLTKELRLPENIDDVGRLK